jgi:hypothetical protein
MNRKIHAKRVERVKYHSSIRVSIHPAAQGPIADIISNRNRVNVPGVPPMNNFPYCE